MSIDPIQSAISVPALSTQTDAAPRSSKPAPPVKEVPAAVMPQARAFEVNASYGSGLLVIYRILDKDTGQLIEQIPPQQFLDSARALQESSAAETNTPKVDLKL